MSKSWITIHTDAAVNGNPGPAGYGAVLQYNKHRKEIFGYLGNEVTVPAAELGAVIIALQAVKHSDRYVAIYSDSKYVVEGANGSWKLKTNEKLWKALKQEIARQKEVIFSWIPREMNKDADRLSKRGVSHIEKGTDKK